MPEFLRKRWMAWKQKSLVSKVFDFVFLALIVMLLTPGGRLTFRTWVLATGLLSGVSQNESVRLSPEVYKWQLQDQNGGLHSFAEYRGKPIFLNFWATWCGPCVAEMPSIAKLIELRSKDVAFLLVTNENPEKVKSFLKNRNWSFPVYFPTTEVPDVFQTTSIPTTMLISKTGTVKHRSSGMTKWDGGPGISFIDELIEE